MRIDPELEGLRPTPPPSVGDAPERTTPDSSPPPRLNFLRTPRPAERGPSEVPGSGHSRAVTPRPVVNNSPFAPTCTNPFPASRHFRRKYPPDPDDSALRELFPDEDEGVFNAIPAAVVESAIEGIQGRFETILSASVLPPALRRSIYAAFLSDLRDLRRHRLQVMAVFNPCLAGYPDGNGSDPAPGSGSSYLLLRRGCGAAGVGRSEASSSSSSASEPLPDSESAAEASSPSSPAASDSSSEAPFCLGIFTTSSSSSVSAVSSKDLIATAGELADHPVRAVPLVGKQLAPLRLQTPIVEQHEVALPQRIPKPTRAPPVPVANRLRPTLLQPLGRLSDKGLPPQQLLGARLHEILRRLHLPPVDPKERQQFDVHRQHRSGPEQQLVPRLVEMRSANRTVVLRHSTELSSAGLHQLLQPPLELRAAVDCDQTNRTVPREPVLLEKLTHLLRSQLHQGTRFCPSGQVVPSHHRNADLLLQIGASPLTLLATPHPVLDRTSQTWPPEPSPHSFSGLRFSPVTQVLVKTPQNLLLVDPRGDHHEWDGQTPPPKLTALQEEIGTLLPYPSLHQIRCTFRVRQVRQEVHHN
ncbi:hypothetical protein PGT21_009573 [Puccinia graminis f. sp. tritici]|uniref:Uncharacterized protein n=1 Tax=Puccinia graminis f. sp. tritici TaxID=56615 RepID=A0A5B0MGY8_PUCGR|nr:hypothetical protein PGT21_009573 [Puccinia graminis f. sp. tritici]